MAYTDAIRFGPTDGAQITTGGAVLLRLAVRRRCLVLGFGLSTVSGFTAGTGAVGGAVALQRSTDGGSTFTTIDTLTLPNANHPGGRVWERSELLRGVSGVTAPEAAMSAVEVNPGDIVRVVVSTAQNAGTGGTAGSYAAYLIVAPRGGVL